jgi:hypothetical protein
MRISAGIGVEVDLRDQVQVGQIIMTPVETGVGTVAAVEAAGIAGVEVGTAVIAAVGIVAVVIVAAGRQRDCNV